MRRAIDHAQDVKILAYRSHDIIRMTCIDDKVDQIKSVIGLAEPRYLMLRTFKSQVAVMQSQFAIISTAHERVTNLTAEIDACMGDNLDAVTVGRIQEEGAVPTTRQPERPDAAAGSDPAHHASRRSQPLPVIARASNLAPCTPRCPAS